MCRHSHKSKCPEVSDRGRGGSAQCLVPSCYFPFPISHFPFPFAHCPVPSAQCHPRDYALCTIHHSPIANFCTQIAIFGALWEASAQAGSALWIRRDVDDDEPSGQEGNHHGRPALRCIDSFPCLRCFPTHHTQGALWRRRPRRCGRYKGRNGPRPACPLFGEHRLRRGFFLLQWRVLPRGQQLLRQSHLLSHRPVS